MPNVRRDQSDDVIVNDLLVHVIGVTCFCRKQLICTFVVSDVEIVDY